MQDPVREKMRRRAELWLRWWKVIQFLVAFAACVAFVGILVMLVATTAGLKTHAQLHDAFIGAVVVFGICMVCATITIWPVERLKRRVNSLTPESEG